MKVLSPDSRLKMATAPYFSLIYGVAYQDDDEEYPPIVYCDTEGGGVDDDHSAVICGFEFGRVHDIFCSPPRSFGGTFQIASSDVPLSIVEEYAVKYPNLKFEKYAVLRNVCHVSSCYGKVMFGYTFTYSILDGIDKDFDFYPSLITNTNTDEADVDADDVGHEGEEKQREVEKIEAYFEAHCVEREIEKCFIGRTLATIENLHELRVGKQNYIAFEKQHYLSGYEISRQSCEDVLRTNGIVYSDLDMHPSISFVPLNCYCCS